MVLFRPKAVELFNSEGLIQLAPDRREFNLAGAKWFSSVDLRSGYWNRFL